MRTLDDLDRGLLHALHVDARSPFTRIAAVLDTSTQTVVRRYGRLRAEAGVRVVGLPDPYRTARQQWFLRLSAAASTAQDIAWSLARRPDTSWVRLTSGGTEIAAIVQTTPDGPDSHALLLHDIPRTSSITAVSAHYLLHMYVGGPTAWPGSVNALSVEQVEALLPTPVEPEGSPRRFTDAERALLAGLLQDGRMSLTELAARTGWSLATVARRIEALRRTGALFFDVEVNDALLGVGASALLWMSVPPRHLDAVATGLAGHPELAFVAATTGRTNLIAQALCPDPAALHRYLTTRLEAEAITAIETAPVLRTLKSVGPVRPG